MSGGQSILESKGYQNYEMKNRRDTRRIVYFIIGFLGLILLALGTNPNAALLLFVLFGIILFVIIFFFAPRHISRHRRFIKGIEILSRVGDPVVNWDEFYAYVIVDDVYIIIQPTFARLYFVKFKSHPRPAEAEPFLRLPRFRIRDPCFGLIGAHRLEGFCRVPNPNGGFDEGNAIVYIVSYLSMDTIEYFPQYTRNECMLLINQLRDDAEGTVDRTSDVSES